MSRVPLSLAFSRNSWTAPILDGTVRAEGADIIPSVVPAGDLFWRQLKYAEFDASEMSLSELYILTAQERDDWVGIPVFPSRGFFHTRVFVSRESGISRPQDLRGKRVGVPEYQQTAALWTRGVWTHYYGVAPSEIQWVMGRGPERSHAALTNFQKPPDIDFSYAEPGTDLGQMLIDGQLDAVIAYGGARNTGLGMGQDPPKSLGIGISFVTYVDPVRRDLDTDPRVAPLYPDPHSAALEYYQSTGLLHINHTLCLRRSLTDRHPWLARSLYDAFAEAREMALAALRRTLEPYSAIGAVDLGALTRAADSMRYGIAANNEALAAAGEYAYEQHLIQKSVEPATLFAETTRHL